MRELTLPERRLLLALQLKNRTPETTVRVYNTRPNYLSLKLYRGLERAGRIEILLVENATTENMLYGMSYITYTLKGN